MFKLKEKLMDGEGGDGNGSGGSGPTLEDMQAQLDEMRAENDKMRNHNKTLLNEKKQIQKELRNFDGLDADSVKSMMAKLEESEEARMIAEGKMDDVLAKRTERLTLDFQQQIDELTNKLNESNAGRDEMSSRYNNLVINTELRKEAEASGMIPAAIDDALNRANGVFSLSDSGEIEARDKDGNLVVVDNKAFTPKAFIADLKESAKHYWPPSEGGGAGGGTGKGGKIANPFAKGTKDYNVTAQAKMRKENPELAAKMQAAAG